MTEHKDAMTPGQVADMVYRLRAYATLWGERPSVAPYPDTAPGITTGRVILNTGAAADVIEAQAAELTALRAERDRDHANINLKADFIAATINDCAQLEAERDAALAEIERLNAGWLEANTTALSNAIDRDAALARVGVLEAALVFYGDISKYPAPLTGGLGDLWRDCGQIARAALANKGAEE